MTPLAATARAVSPVPVAETFRHCARCGRRHEDLVFTPFTRTIAAWTHWALCPTTGEPLLMKVIAIEISKG